MLKMIPALTQCKTNKDTIKFTPKQVSPSPLVVNGMSQLKAPAVNFVKRSTPVTSHFM